MRTRYLLPAAALVGGLLAANGVLFLLAPPTTLDLFGLGGEPSAALPPLLGIREIAFGLAIVLLVRLREVRTVAVFLLVGALVPVVDAAVVIRAVSVLAALPHLAAIPVCLTLGVLTWRAGRS